MNSGTKIGMLSKLKNLFHKKTKPGNINLLIVKEKEVPVKVDYTQVGKSLSKINSMLIKSDYNKRLSKNEADKKIRLKKQWDKEQNELDEYHQDTKPLLKMTREQKATIDKMTQYEICKFWRFSKPGNPLQQGEAGQYLMKQLSAKGGFTPAISKNLGWDMENIK